MGSECLRHCRRRHSYISLSHFHEVVLTRLAPPEISLIRLRVVKAKVGDRLIFGKFADRCYVATPPLRAPSRSPDCFFPSARRKETQTEARASSTFPIQR